MQSGILRTGNDAFSELTRKHQVKPERFRTRIKHVGYVNRKIAVAGRGYSGPRKVSVQVGIDLGTVERPKVYVDQVAIIEHTDEGKWLCVAIRQKNVCQVGTSDATVELEVDSANSFSVQSYGANVTPLDLFIPPFEPLGTYPPIDERFPDIATFLCGKPPCSDCGTPQPGMSPVLQAEGCWKWDFRQGCCAGRPLVKSQYTVDTRTTPQGAVMAVSGVYSYVLVQSGTATDAVHLHVIDSTDPLTPVEVGLLNAGISQGVDSVDELYDTAELGGLMLTSVKYGSSPDAWGWQPLSVTDPTAPVVGGGTNIDFRYLGHFIQVFVVSSIPYIITNYVEGVGADFPQGYFIALVGTGADVSAIGTSAAIDSFDLQDNLVYGCENGGNFLIHDVSVPASPTARGNITSAFGTGQCIKASGDYAWVGDSSSNEVVGIDVSDPDSPSVISTTSLSAEPVAIDVCGDYLYISLVNGTVVAYDISDPTAPSQPVSDTLSSFDSLVKQMYIGGNQVHVLGFDSGSSETTLGILRA